jgi:MFS family permease
MRDLRSRGFALLLAGEAIDAIGTWVGVIAIWGFAAFKFHASAGDVAMLLVVLSVPPALLGPALGVPIDRFGPKRMLVLAALLGALNTLALTQAHTFLAVVLLALPLGVVEGLANASINALPPRLVPDEQLVRANALLGGAQDFAIVIGPLVATLIYGWWGLGGAFAFDAATWVVCAVVATRIRLEPHVREPSERSTWHELVDGLRLAVRRVGVRWTLVTATSVYSLWAVFGVLEPLYVREVLHESASTFALLQTTYGVGIVIVSLGIARWGAEIAKPTAPALAMTASGITAALYVGTRVLPIAFVGVFLWGALTAFFFVPTRTLLQRFTPIEYHGRVLALNDSLEGTVAIVVSPLTALAVGMVGVQALGVAGGVITLVGGLFIVRAVRGVPVPEAGPVDPTAGSPRDAVALGGPAPG